MTIIACVLFVSASPEPPTSTLPWGGRDFVQYYVAWELIRDGKNPYDQHLAGARQLELGREVAIQTFAPPWALLPSFIVAAFPFPQAVVGYIAINIVLLLFCTICWNSILFPGRLSYSLFMLVGVSLWFPSIALLVFGQNSVWPLAGFTGWLWCITRRRFIPAGLFLVLTIVKPHLGLMPGIFAGIYSLRHRHWTTIVAFALGLLAATGATLWFRPTIWTEYITALQTGVPPTHFSTATLDRWLREQYGELFSYVFWTLWIASLFLSAVVAWTKFNGQEAVLTSKNEMSIRHPLIKWSILICMATVVFVPYAFHFDFIFMLPSFYLATGLWLANKRGGRIALAFWVFLIVGFIMAHLAEWNHANYWIFPWSGLGFAVWLLRNQNLHQATSE